MYLEVEQHRGDDQIKQLISGNSKVSYLDLSFLKNQIMTVYSSFLPQLF